MGLNIVEKILQNHLATDAKTDAGEIALNIDYTLTQDSTGTLAYLQFESLNIPKVKTKLSVSFVDHNTLQAGFENADDHKYLQTVAEKYGINFSRPGNGICHQVFLERFAVPGMTLIGSDSHTPTAGGMGMIAIGAGGLNIAVAMAGKPYFLKQPKVCKVELVGELAPWATAKDIILELLKRLSVKGGVNTIFEYTGSGVKNLSVPERATITNMGAELGATTSIFPSDEVTKEFLKAQGREDVWTELIADSDAAYDEEVVIDLSALEPLVAKPHSPDNVVPVKELEGTVINQVFIGSCTNSSYMDLMKVAAILKGKNVHPNVSLAIAPGSKQVFTMLAENGALADIINSGARILESACGPCIGMGQAPQSAGISLRTNNRNFKGRSGTADAGIYLVSPEVAAVSAINGVVTDPRTFGEPIIVEMPEKFLTNDNMIIKPREDSKEVEVVRGPNIKALKKYEDMEEQISAKVVLKVEDNITTDDIMPSNASLLPFRSNIPHLANFCFAGVDPDFSERAKQAENGFIIAGDNYGQGSSREHAALVPRFLGIRAVIAKSFARIHYDNLINMGILPLNFANEADYDKLDLNAEVQIKDIKSNLEQAKDKWILTTNEGTEIELKSDFSARQRDVLLAGGLLNYTKKNQ
ncbi:aconitase [Desulfonispora thiosulfatigenes DSM 11270]|uniref:Aconitase n=1 Tax=Desulfonispora thiosulfatigenes DSM 11270 TaxID=656914 RepID=A0A1W1UKV3_DESTI|nr:aconitate hydratase [Desulfonispora thiosulfatigenes]SMB81726.1 aconitase [Desulfonispora thiosulfatigenes DSM 11270]